MYVKKNISLRGIVAFSWLHMIWLSLWAIISGIFYQSFDFEWMKIPWLPMSVLGTAVAFYIGFKNNSAYDRLWEARKIWGAIVNSSRMLAATLKAYTSNQFTDSPVEERVIIDHRKSIVYRHIAWLYQLREQLLIPTSWEHLRSRGKHPKSRYFENRKRTFGIGMYDQDVTSIDMKQYLAPEELQRIMSHKNPATHLIDQQAQEVKDLRTKGLIDDFRHVELQHILNDLYTHQGKCERIKKFPLPRQYGSMSFVFVSIFILLLPFGLVPAFQDLSPEWGALISIPFTALIGWVYVMMELIGDYSENPFQGLGNDIPMLALCRTIEIDLREMLGEEDLPPPIEPVRNVLM